MNESKKKKSSKALFIIIGAILIVGVILFLTLNGANSSEEKLLLKCSSHDEYQYFTVDRVVALTKKGDKVLYDDIITATKLTQNEEINNILNSYFMVNGYDRDKKGIVSYSENGNVLEVKVKINITEADEETMRVYVGTYDTSTSNFRKHFEDGGLICEEF